MAIIGITGGIASGKSTFVKSLSSYLLADLFDCDAFVHDLLESDKNIQQQIVTSFGADVVASDGTLNRSTLRKRIFTNTTDKTHLEAILHPRVHRAWQDMAHKKREQKLPFIVDIPLLFETQVESLFDITVVVGCLTTTQIERMTTLRGFSHSSAMNVLSAQLPLKTKMQKASHIVWNEGALEILDHQAKILAQFVSQYD